MGWRRAFELLCVEWSIGGDWKPFASIRGQVLSMRSRVSMLCLTRGGVRCVVSPGHVSQFSP